MAVVVLPTPPFWLATAITRPMFDCRESAGKLRLRQVARETQPQTAVQKEESCENVPRGTN
jgi:hypothetical protein